MLRRLEYLLTGLVGLFVIAPPSNLSAQSIETTDVGAQVKGVLGLLGISVIPNESASALTINTADGDTKFLATQFGGSHTFSKGRPIYIEGYIGAARFDPKYLLASDEVVEIEARWTNVAGTVGIGWDFNLSDELVLRPIVNFSLAHATSSATLIGDIIGPIESEKLDFLKDGSVNAFGYGGSLMLDWHRYRDDYEADLEVRYSNIRLETFGGTSAAVEGASTAASLGAWSRLRIPTGYHAFQRPLRGVGELSASWLIGDQSTTLGAEWLTSLGLGLEADLEAADWSPVARVRVLGRVLLGDGLSGFSVGVGLSL